MNDYRPLRPTIVTADEAPPLKAFGLDLKILLATEATNGTLSVLMAWHKPGEGPPDHVHYSQDEMFFVLEGRYEVTAGGETATVGRGALVFTPRHVVHRFKNVGKTTACMIDFTMPGGHDHYFKAIAALAANDQSTGERVQEINRKFDTHFLAAL